MAVKGRVRIQDPTCLYDVRAPANSDVWVVFVREKWKPLWAPMIGDADYDTRSKQFMEDKTLGEREFLMTGISLHDEKLPFKNIAQDLKDERGIDILTGVAEKSMPPDISGELSHYWKPTYWFGPRNHEPPVNMYNNSDFVGHAEKLYYVHDVFGASSNIQYKAWAQDVFRPETPTSKWQDSYVQLGSSDVMCYMHNQVVW